MDGATTNFVGRPFKQTDTMNNNKFRVSTSCLHKHDLWMMQLISILQNREGENREQKIGLYIQLHLSPFVTEIITFIGDNTEGDKWDIHICATRIPDTGGRPMGQWAASDRQFHSPSVTALWETQGEK